MYIENPELEAMNALYAINNTEKTSKSVFVELEHVVIKKDEVTISYSSFTDDWESEILVIYTGTLSRDDKFTLNNRQIYIDGAKYKSSTRNIGIDFKEFEKVVKERINTDIEKKLKNMQNVDFETKAMGLDLLDSLCMINEEHRG